MNTPLRANAAEGEYGALGHDALGGAGTLPRLPRSTLGLGLIRPPAAPSARRVLSYCFSARSLTRLRQSGPRREAVEHQEPGITGLACFTVKDVGPLDSMFDDRTVVLPTSEVSFMGSAIAFAADAFGRFIEGPRPLARHKNGHDPSAPHLPLRFRQREPQNS